MCIRDRFDIPVEVVVSVNMTNSTKHLTQNTAQSYRREIDVSSGFHELIQVLIHRFH